MILSIEALINVLYASVIYLHSTTNTEQYKVASFNWPIGTEFHYISKLLYMLAFMLILYNKYMES